jgi:hypothetical protein
LAVPSSAHLAAAGPDVAALLRAFDVGQDAEAVEDLDALPRHAPFGRERLDPIFDDHGEAQFLLEAVAAGGDEFRLLERGQGGVARKAAFLLVDLLRPNRVRARWMRAAPSDRARGLRAGHPTT